MKIHLKCFADLAERFECDYHAASPLETAGGADVAEVMRRSGIPEESVKIVFVNGRIADPHAPLVEGDRVTLVPATGGM